MALKDIFSSKYVKAIGIGTCVIILVTLGYYIYDYGYMSGVADKQQEVNDLKAQAQEQYDKLTALEQQMSQSAIEYEQLRLELSQKENEVKKWQQNFKDKEQPSLSVDAVQFLNSLL